MPLSAFTTNDLLTEINKREPWPLSLFPTDQLLAELNRTNPWLDRIQTAPLVGDIEPATLAARDSRKSHSLVGYKFEKNGRVKYRWLDIQDYIRRQQMPM